MNFHGAYFIDCMQLYGTTTLLNVFIYNIVDIYYSITVTTDFLCYLYYITYMKNILSYYYQFSSEIIFLYYNSSTAQENKKNITWIVT